MLSRRHIKHATPHGEVDRRTALAVEGQQGGRGEGAEDDGSGFLGQFHGPLGSEELVVDQHKEEREQDQVDGRGDGHPG